MLFDRLIKPDQKFYTIAYDGYIAEQEYDPNNDVHNNLIRYGNFFETYHEASIIRDIFQAILELNKIRMKI